MKSSFSLSKCPKSFFFLSRNYFAQLRFGSFLVISVFLYECVYGSLSDWHFWSYYHSSLFLSLSLYNWIDSIFLLVSLYFLFHFGLYLSMPYWAPSECVCVCAASCSPVGISTLLELRVVPVATFLFLSLYQVFTQCRIRRNIELLSLPSRSLSFPYIMTTQCIGVNVPFDSGLFVQFFSDLGIFAILIMWGRRGWASQFLLGVCAFFLLQ